MSVVVSDSSPLNYLAALHDFDLLRQIYGTLLIPPAVHTEVVEHGGNYPVQAAVRLALGRWIWVADAPDGARVQNLRRECRLDLGECEAIIVAEALGDVPLLMDERRGVRCARSRGLVVVRTPLIYTDAKILGLIGNVRIKLDALPAKGFHLSDAHYQEILREIGELQDAKLPFAHRVRKRRRGRLPGVTPGEVAEVPPEKTTLSKLPSRG